MSTIPNPPLRAVPREELEISGQRVIENSKGDEVALTYSDTAAEFIVKASNAHGDLVNALMVALPFVEDAEQDESYKAGSVKKAIATIRASLSKAGAL